MVPLTTLQLGEGGEIPKLLSKIKIRRLDRQNEEIEASRLYGRVG